MSQIFSRRKGSVNSLQVDQNTSFNAAAAATQAFMQTSTSMTSLSSAAAAAALRSHTTSPEPVGSVQTKRMQRRGSASSTGSGNGARGDAVRPGLQRSNSSGSMTERTFRSPSPGRRNGTMSPSSPGSDVPPVPALPPAVQKRSSSMDPPQRIMSPTPQEGKRGSSVDRAKVPPPATTRHAKRLSNVTEAEEAGRLDNGPNSPSRNFSRPMSPQQSSPVTAGSAKKYTHGTGSWFTQASTTNATARPKTSDGLTSHKPSAPPLDVALASSQPVKKHRVSSAPGSHLARANQNHARSSSITSSTASYDTEDSVMVYDPNSRTFVRKMKPSAAEPSSPDSSQADVVFDPNTRSFVPRVTASRNLSTSAPTPTQSGPVPAPTQLPKTMRPNRPAKVDTSTITPSKQSKPSSSGSPSPSSPPMSPRNFTGLHKQPSVVREDPEAEEQAEASGPVSRAPKEISPSPQTTAQTLVPAKAYVAPVTPHQRSVSLDVPRPADNAARGRNTSISPRRSAHFSPSPILKPERHDPLPRDVSPGKSAMKRSPASSIRTSSPVAMFLPPGATITSTMSPPSESSEDTTSQDGLGGVRKKKTVRVSFDEQPQAIEAQDASTASRTVPTINADEDDALMKPRPALPSFGSVRGNRVQPEVAEKVTEMPPERHEMSSDHAIAGILRNSMEVLPPEVTSKESAGYASDESSDVEVPAVSSAANPEPATVGAGRSLEAGEPRVKDFAETAPTKQYDGEEHADNGDVPAINLLPPTPGIEDESAKQLRQDATDAEQLQPEDDDFSPRSKSRSSMEISVPGGWGEEDENEEKIADEDRSIKPETSAPEPESSASSSTAEDIAATQLGPPVQLHASPQELSDIDEDSDDSAAFSDAVEDPSDLEDEGGFASLDAVVESPIVSPSPVEWKSKAKTTAADEPPESPLAKQSGIRAVETDADGDGWGKATAYWSQLSKQQREQIERQHVPPEEEVQPTPAVVTAKKSKPKQQVPTPTQSRTAPSSRAAKQASAPRQAPPSPQQDSAAPTMRKSMRAQPGPAPVDHRVHMRSSMRTGGGGGMGTTLRGGPPQRRPQSENYDARGALQKKSMRPMSESSFVAASTASTKPASRPSTSSGVPSQDSAFPAFAPKKVQKQPPAETPQVSTRLQRELAGANESDSESSFKKRRRAGSASTTDTQNITLRRSMRAGSIDQAPPLPQQARPTSPSANGGNRGGFRLRSMSPPASKNSFWNRNKGEKPTQTEGPRTTMRGPPASRDGSARRSSASAKPTATISTPAKSRFKSRFADSDDEDEGDRPTRYRSRFADSDDDEPSSPTVIPAGLTPVRGIPRRKGQDDGDSTDLEDEEDEDPRKASRSRVKMQTPLVPDPTDVDKAMAAARKNLGIPAEPTPKASASKIGEGSALAKGSLREEPKEETAEPVSRPQDINFSPPEKKKRGFMGSILRRNRDNTSSVQQVRQSNPPPPVPSSPAVATPASTQTTKQEAPSTPSSPSTKRLIRKTSNQPALTRGESNLSTVATPLATTNDSPFSNRKDTDDWPLTSPQLTIENNTQNLGNQERPNTSDGSSPEAIKLARTMRPDLARRSQSGTSGPRVRIQAGEEGSEPGERESKAVYSRRTGKKKKFGMLRRAFGIDD